MTSPRLSMLARFDAAVVVAASALLVTAIAVVLGDSRPLGFGAVAAGMVVPAVAALSVLRRKPVRTTGADRVTLLRAVLAGGCVAMVVLAFGDALPLRSWPLFALALPAVLTDAVDGWLARRSGTSSPDGARLDMETDAALVLVLSVPLAWAVGPWVLLIGVMRYLFLVLGHLRPALTRSLAFSQFRRVVAGTQAVVLVVATMPITPQPLAAFITAMALLLLLISFGRDTIGLERSFRGTALAAPPAARTPDGAVVQP